jgi:diaminohydroxyphosphoribosylaminopyrimidine deaminase/5-amino-6-(5-phosphoribosylamino)uracil reductase
MKSKKINMYMNQALELSKRGRGFVSPNPLAGAIIVKNGKIVGTGYHQYFGGHHAEKQAILDAEEHGNSVENSTLFVTLEPCIHYGKTPPCVQLIVEKKISTVFVAVQDPNPKASGGIEFLKKAGVNVYTGIQKEQAETINRFFFFSLQKKRPFFLGKVALSQNGYITKQEGTATKISGGKSQYFTHQLRMQCDALLIGVNTANIDNPLLSVRFGEKKRDPLRVVLDPNGKIKRELHLFRDDNFLYITGKKYKQIPLPHKNIILLETNTNGVFPLSSIAEILYKKGILSVLVEGGANTIHHFLSQNFLDELILIQSSTSFPDTGVPLFPKGFPISLQQKQTKKLGNDVMSTFQVKK